MISYKRSVLLLVTLLVMSISLCVILFKSKTIELSSMSSYELELERSKIIRDSLSRIIVNKDMEIIKTLRNRDSLISESDLRQKKAKEVVRVIYSTPDSVEFKMWVKRYNVTKDDRDGLKAAIASTSRDLRGCEVERDSAFSSIVDLKEANSLCDTALSLTKEQFDLMKEINNTYIKDLDACNKKVRRRGFFNKLLLAYVVVREGIILRHK